LGNTAIAFAVRHTNLLTLRRHSGVAPGATNVRKSIGAAMLRSGQCALGAFSGAAKAAFRKCACGASIGAAMPRSGKCALGAFSGAAMPALRRCALGAFSASAVPFADARDS